MLIEVLIEVLVQIVTIYNFLPTILTLKSTFPHNIRIFNCRSFSLSILKVFLSYNSFGPRFISFHHMCGALPLALKKPCPYDPSDDQFRARDSHKHVRAYTIALRTCSRILLFSRACLRIRSFSRTCLRMRSFPRTCSHIRWFSRTRIVLTRLSFLRMRKLNLRFRSNKDKKKDVQENVHSYISHSGKSLLCITIRDAHSWPTIVLTEKNGTEFERQTLQN